MKPRMKSGGSAAKPATQCAKKTANPFDVPPAFLLIDVPTFARNE